MALPLPPSQQTSEVSSFQPRSAFSLWILGIDSGHQAQVLTVVRHVLTVLPQLCLQPKPAFYVEDHSRDFPRGTHPTVSGTASWVSVYVDTVRMWSTGGPMFICIYILNNQEEVP